MQFKPCETLTPGHMVNRKVKVESVDPANSNHNSCGTVLKQEVSIRDQFSCKRLFFPADDVGHAAIRKIVGPWKYKIVVSQRMYIFQHYQKCKVYIISKCIPDFMLPLISTKKSKTLFYKMPTIY